MKKNISSADRIIRVIIVAIVVILYLTHIITGALGIVLMAAAAILLLTTIINFCPLYYMLGITSKQKQKKHA